MTKNNVILQAPTFSKASLHTPSDHIGGQSRTVKLQAGNSSAEVASVTLSCSNSDLVICSQ